MARSPQAPIATIVERLRRTYPDARYELDWKTPFQLLVATILAAQCTDERVNRVTATLFPAYPTPRALAEVPAEELEKVIQSTGFYKQKTRTLQGCSRMLVERFGGEVPATMEELTELPGVARKTANVVLTMAFGLPSGIIVDTHVKRVAPRLGLSDREQPDDIEQDLMKLVNRKDWTFIGPALVLHGRRVCVARKPKCSECPLEDICPKRGV